MWVGRGKRSADVGLHLYVPPGSVLGLTNYCTYAKPVGEIIKHHIIKYHCYANDTKMYMILKLCDKWDDISSSIEACIADISTCMKSNMLKLNKDRIHCFLIQATCEEN